MSGSCTLLSYLLLTVFGLSQWWTGSSCRRSHPGTHNLPLSVEDSRFLTKYSTCLVLLVESMPENLNYSSSAPKHASTYFAWKLLVDQARSNLSIASFYWSLIADPLFNASAIGEGRDIFESLLQKAKEVNITIAQNGAKKADAELDKLAAAGSQIYWIDFMRLFRRGVLHTKLWTVDSKHGYLGSANMDWRSLTEVKELGSLMLNCPELVKDLHKIHTTYCLAANGIPITWPDEVKTSYNHTHPLRLHINRVPSRVYFAGSPDKLNPSGRTSDLDAILTTIAAAEKFIYISVMNYIPEVVIYGPHASAEFWPVIDDALRTAAINRKVEVRLLISRWRHSPSSMPKYLSSLRAVNDIHESRIRIRYFVVPSFTENQRRIPYARVNHNKYMVTDKAVYIGTSNWSGDYFKFTGGAAFVAEEDAISPLASDGVSDARFHPPTLRSQLVDIFLRDWNSDYTLEE